MNKQEIYRKMSEAVVSGETEVLLAGIKSVIGQEDPLEIVQEGLVQGLKKIGELFESGEIFLPEMLMAADAFQEGMKLLNPKLEESGKTLKKPGVVVFGTVMHDIHEIGKNIVITLMTTHGFEVHDLGAGVSPTIFVEKAEAAKADVIAMSALMTTTMTYQKDAIEYLVKKGLRDKYIALVGGGPVNEEWAAQIGADGTSDSAVGAVDVAKRLIARRK
jgi:trimethylamine corrinoid protein